MQKHKTTGIIAGVILLFVLLGFTVQPAAAVPPNLVPGNPSCESQGYDFGFKPQPEPPPSGTYAFPDDPYNTVTINSDGTYFDWSSTLGIDAVIVKGGPNANIYVYDPEAFSDTGLHSPINPNNDEPYAISHIEFCYDYELDVSKDAETSFTRTWEWDIEKAVNPGSFDLFAGESGTASYDVTVTKTGYTDSDWAVSGTITIENNTPFDAEITDVSDLVSPDISAAVDCGDDFSIILASGDTLECSYSTNLPDAENRLNTATVTTDPAGTVGGGNAQADVTFGDPTTEVNAEVNVSDDYGTPGDLDDDLSWGPVGDTTSFEYDRNFSCSSDPADYTDGYYDYTVTNTAEIIETEQSDDASVEVRCYAPLVSKTAETSFTREYHWKINKSVDPGTLQRLAGGSGDADWTVVVTADGFTDKDWAVSGTITVVNPHPTQEMIVALSDVVSPDIAATLDCEGTLTVPAEGEATCDYGTPLPDGSDRTNTATATFNSIDFTAEADVAFGEPTGTENASVTVEDDLEGTLGSVIWAVDASMTFEYTRTYGCSSDPGDYTDGDYDYSVDNTATIVETGQSDDASLAVECFAPVVTKNAQTSFTRSYQWSIDKRADENDLLLSDGQLYLVNYAVEVDLADYTDSDWAVSGTIWVANNSPLPMPIDSVTDMVSGGFQANVVCDPAFEGIIAAGQTLECTYSADLPDAQQRTNTANAVMNGINFSGSADVVFGDPTDLVDECIDVSDTNTGFLGTVCVDDAPRTFTYSLWFGAHPDADVQLVCGENTHLNTASFIANDTSATGQDSWTVNAEVACALGCTLTPGYWKTHSINGPAPYDDTWAQISEDTSFFSSGQTYYQVLWTAPKKGNAYYILAHAYIAAELNQLNGASIPGDVLDAFQDATALFNEFTPDEIVDLKGKNGKELRDQFISLAEILDDYNNGLLGPGHCSE